MQIDKSNDGKNRDRYKVIRRLHFAGMAARLADGKAWLKAVMAVLGLLTASCSGPEPGGQIIAVVDGDAITQSELRQAYDLSGAEGNRRDVANQAIEEMINVKLLAAAARERGAGRTATYHFAQRRAEQQLLIEALREILLDEAADPSPQEITRFIAQNPQSFSRRKAIAMQDQQSGNLQWVDTSQLALTPEIFDGLAIGQNVEVAQRVYTIADMRPVDASEQDQRKLAKQQIREVSVNKEIARILQESRAESVVKYKSGWGPSAR